MTFQKSFFMSDILQILSDVTGVWIDESQLKITAHTDLNSFRNTLTFKCQLDDEQLDVSLFGFLLYYYAPKEPRYRLTKIFYNKPWWKPFGRKIIGFTTEILYG